MQFAKLFIIAATAIAGASAKVQFTNTIYNNVTAGLPYVLNWANATGPVTINLKNGPATALVTVSTIGSGLTGTSFTYPVPASLPADTYAFEIIDGTTTNYSPQFQLLGATASVTSTASSTGSSSSASSASTSGASTTSGSATASTTASSSGNSTSSATGSTSSGSASKTSSGSSSATKSSTPTSSTSAVPTTNAASEFASPLALVFLTVAALLSLN